MSGNCGVRNWWNPVRNRDSWQKLLKKTLAQRGQRWEDGVMEDARKLGERIWRNTARNRDSWQKLLKKALAQRGLLCRW